MSDFSEGLESLDYLEDIRWFSSPITDADIAEAIRWFSSPITDADIAEAIRRFRVTDRNILAAMRTCQPLSPKAKRVRKCSKGVDEAGKRRDLRISNLGSMPPKHEGKLWCEDPKELRRIKRAKRKKARTPTCRSRS